MLKSKKFAVQLYIHNNPSKMFRTFVETNQVYFISLLLLDHSHIQVFCGAQKRSLDKHTKIQYPGLRSVKQVQIL